jgi:hypothetical protein
MNLFKEAIRIVEILETEVIALKAERIPESEYQDMKTRLDDLTVAAMKIESERNAIIELHMQTMERLLKNAATKPA